MLMRVASVNIRDVIKVKRASQKMKQLRRSIRNRRMFISGVWKRTSEILSKRAGEYVGRTVLTIVSLQPSFFDKVKWIWKCCNKWPTDRRGLVSAARAPACGTKASENNWAVIWGGPQQGIEQDEAGKRRTSDSVRSIRLLFSSVRFSEDLFSSSPSPSSLNTLTSSVLPRSSPPLDETCGMVHSRHSGITAPLSCQSC